MLKKNITIFFILATVVFCILLYYFLFLTDHRASKFSIALLIVAMIGNTVTIVWLFNKYMKLPVQKGAADSVL